MDGDDGVEITDDDTYQVETNPPKNQDLSSLSMMAGELLSQYGWFLLLGSVLLYLLVQYLSKKRSSQGHRSPTALTPQDAAVVERRHEAMEAARRKMQEELDAKAAIFKEKQRQQEEEKRQQRIEVWENLQLGKSNKGAAKLSQKSEDVTSSSSSSSTSSSSVKPKTEKRPLRSTDYNPLTGEGGASCSWRPGRRGPSSGG
ncbi:selenoprotein S [Solea senegalensis]|uniref:Selenoprotein S n=1 Tax=Solea senegalensis TaxID=28829 RepID=A0AAV6PM24_SOLSE|nr:selenoprotein S [Solea senegalensis]KAG7466774.1 selenoprotein S [Solea senegalensis]